jgi:hypothetical protein
MRQRKKKEAERKHLESDRRNEAKKNQSMDWTKTLRI